jgi:hypothetical protein
MRFKLTVGLILLFTPLSVSAADSDGQAQTNHEANGRIDPVYQQLADKTGGKVYDMRTAEGRRAFEEDQIRKPRREARWRLFKDFIDVRRINRILPGSEGQRFFIYALLKWLAYAVWCGVGLALAGRPKNRFLLAGWWGLVRVFLGLSFGLLIGSVVLSFRILPTLTWLGPRLTWFFLYLLIYLPVRLIEWSILARWLRVSDYSWRLQGIMVSCTVDFLQIVLLGSLIPIGRFVC